MSRVVLLRKLDPALLEDDKCREDMGPVLLLTSMSSTQFQMEITQDKDSVIGSGEAKMKAEEQATDESPTASHSLVIAALL